MTPQDNPPNSNNVFWRGLDGDADKNYYREVILQRARHLENLSIEAELSTERYLMLVNAGAVVVIISLLGELSEVRSHVPIYVAAACFIISILLIGFVKIVRIIRNYKIKGEWDKSTTAFYRGLITYQHLNEAHAKVWKYPLLMIAPAWGAMALFIAGCIMSIIEIASTFAR